MPATSAAALKRRLLGLDPPKDKRKQIGALAMHAKRTGKSERHVKAGRSTVAVKGGRQTAARVTDDVLSLRAKMAEIQNDVQFTATRLAPEAMAYLGRLVRGQEIDAGHRERIAAAKVVLEVAGITGQQTVAQNNDAALNEMSVDALHALLADMQRHQQMAVVEGDAARVPDTTSGEQSVESTD